MKVHVSLTIDIPDAEARRLAAEDPSDCPNERAVVGGIALRRVMSDLQRAAWIEECGATVSPRK
jgi:hypothetical protein